MKTLIHAQADLAKLHIRWLIRRDMPEVLDIEYANLSPWTEEDFLGCLRERNCIGMVAEIGEPVGTRREKPIKKKRNVRNKRNRNEFSTWGIW